MLCACGRLDFDGGQAGIVRFAMDDDPAHGYALASPPVYSATCEVCPTSVPGKHGGGYHFDGTAHLELPTGVLVGAMPYSIAVWANPDATDVFMTTIAKPLSTTTTSDTLNLLIAPSGVVDMETTPGGESLDYLPGVTVVTGGWHHIVATWDGTTKSIYVDGALDATEDASIDDTNEVTILIGADKDGLMYLSPFVGVMDELLIYDRALSSSEIAAMK